MQLSVSHEILVSGPDLATCRARVRRFFDRYQLVKYDTIRIDEKDAVNAAQPIFFVRLEQGIAANRKVLSGLIEDLHQQGFTSLDDLLTLPQGLASKTLHLASHLLDGFFGIDSLFYDLDDDSHWFTEERRRQIARQPAFFWLLKVTASSANEDADRVQLMREAGEAFR